MSVFKEKERKPERFIIVYALSPEGFKRAKMETRQPLSYDEALILGSLQAQDNLTIGQLADIHNHIPSPYAVVNRLIDAGLVEKHQISL